jgi:hypothetical protein
MKDTLTINLNFSKYTKGENKMKKSLMIIFAILYLVAFGVVTSYAEGFIHPLDFTGTKNEKAEVISFIEKDVKETYTSIGMGSSTTLRMMETENLSCFKQLTKVENRKLLDQVISTYCEIGMCNYSTILMMYNEELKASKETLTW